MSVSLAVHALAVVTAIVAARGRAPTPSPPIYRVSLVAARATSTGNASGVASATPTTSAALAHHPAPAAAGSAAAAPAPPATHAAVHHAAAHAAVAHPAPPAPKPHVQATRPHATAGAFGTRPTLSPAHVTPAAAPTPSVTHRAAVPPLHPSRPAASPRTPSPRAAGAAPSIAAAHPPAVASSKPASTAAAVRGGGGGTPAARGHDAADVHVVGLEFPFPGYLANLVRQVRLRFTPTDARAGLHTDLAFVVARDGSISGLRVVRGSGSYAFDLEAQGAVEAAGSAGAFGPLPEAFRASALPVSFSFDPNTAP